MLEFIKQSIYLIKKGEIMKLYYFLILFLVFNLFLYSETIILKNGEKITGKIEKIENDSITIETEYGKVIIDKEKIDLIKYDNEKKKEEVKEKEIDPTTKMYYKKYKSFLNLGIGLIIPGGICTLTPLVFFTPPIIMGFYNYGTTLFSNPLFVYGFSWYIIVLVVGICLDIGAIVAFVNAGKNYKEWLKREENASIKIYTGFEKEKILIAFGIKLK